MQIIIYNFAQNEKAMTLEEYVKSFGYEVSELTKEELEAARQELENKDNLNVLDGPDFALMVSRRKMMEGV